MLDLRQQFGEFITQGLTFLLFVWVIKRFAWPALKKVLDERQQKIEAGFVDIERRQADLAAKQQEYEKRLHLIEQEARERIQEGVAEGRRVAAELTENARLEAARITERAQRNIDLEVAKARVTLRDDVVNLTINVAESLLRERMNEETNRRLVDRFIEDLEQRRS